jgi:CDP-glucose 4,6-dehydratase
LNPAFWHDKRVVVTGHTGFKGGWLTVWLRRLGARVTGYSLDPPSDPSFLQEAEVEAGIGAHRADVRDLDTLVAVFESARPEVVFHLAAQSLVRRSYREPLETYSTNVMGTANVLEAARRTEVVRAVIAVTSDKCYENLERAKPYRESDRLGGRDPYASSKAAAELVTSAYRQSFFRADNGPAVASARAGNVIGGGDWAEDRLVPDLIRGFTSGLPVRIRNPEAVRPWQHVVEPLRGYLTLAERLWNRDPGAASAWNFGPNRIDERPVRWIAERMSERWGAAATWEHDGGDHPHEATYLRLDSSKAAERLGWSPRLPLETALEWVVDWHLRRNAGEPARAITEEQLAAYEALVGGAQ